MEVLQAGNVQVTVVPEAGARLGSLRVDGLELLVTEGPGPTLWGCFPMAPWAGRTRHGRFSFDGAEVRLPVNLPPHAIHGTVFERAWHADGGGSYSIDLGPDWPFGGRAVHTVRPTEDALALRLEVHADDRPMPASCGWHPWFRRRLARGAPAELSFDAAWMELRDAEGIPGGQRVPPPPGPWDDCFGGLRQQPVLTWPGALELAITSTCDYLVVFDKPEHAICVEPQSAPPDALNRTPAVVEPGQPLVAETTWSWRLPSRP